MITHHRYLLSGKFHPEIELDEHFNYSCCLVDLSIQNFIYNWIKVIEGENKFDFEVQDSLGNTITHVDIDPEKYELNYIADRLESEAKIARAGKMRLRFDRIIQRCVIETQKSVCIDFTKMGTIGERLGFDRRRYCGETLYVAEHPIDIDNNSITNDNIHTIRVNCDLVSGVFRDGVNTHTLHEFQANSVVSDLDYKMVEQPKNLIYLPVTRRRISSIHVTLTDQDDNPIIFDDGTQINCRIHLKRESKQ